MSSSSSLTPSSAERDGAGAGELEGAVLAGRALDRAPLADPALDAVDRARGLRAAGR